MGDVVGAVVDSLMEQWDLRPDGPAIHGSRSLVVPVRTSASLPAVLKVGGPDAPDSQEHLVLRRWAGDGAARLLRADPRRRALLLERLQARSLAAVPDVEACGVIADLYRRLHVPAMPQLSPLGSQVQDWVRDFGALPRSAPIPRRLVEQASALGRELAGERVDSERVLHGYLHYGTVLASDRQPWLSISPRPLNGDPHAEIAPMLWHRWDDLAGHIRDGVRARFWALADAAGFDEDRARAWVIVRVVHEATRELARGAAADGAALTRFVAIAKAVQD
ncbi:aminoglycoside phosphotransferase family protein [Mycolicibacterium confluentis]|uniref:aminoglycoside phosphotransferase family protein n=1 Tax=Mycolicibacterium confluentis TaxID=28047 RepID=UPI001F29771B|nr:aminoglycoside phosphotransferase family protein [Mycolicibacterium confluentis]